HFPIEECPLCGSEDVSDFELDDESSEIHVGENQCECTHCQFMQAHQPGKPCKEQVCPQCGSFMKRKGGPGRRGRKMQGI
ncbi:MAG: hypothetical protein GX762_00235, partial [Bacteroidales bacterium]|nr:hypothetical protein [Bacteroidales bacterium]